MAAAHLDRDGAGKMRLTHDRELFFVTEPAAVGAPVAREPDRRCVCQAAFVCWLLSSAASTAAYFRKGARMKPCAPVDCYLAGLQQIAPASQAGRRDTERRRIMSGSLAAPIQRLDMHRPERLNGARPSGLRQRGVTSVTFSPRLVFQGFGIPDRSQPAPKSAHVEPVLPAIPPTRQTATPPCLDVNRPPLTPSPVLEMFRPHRRSSHVRRNPIWTARARPKSVQDPDGYDQPTDGKGKGRPSARLMWLGRLRNSPTTPTLTAGAFCKLCKHFKASSAVALNCRRAQHHDDARRRPAGPARAHPARQPWWQATTDLRRRGDAGREEGGPCRQQLPFEPGPQPVALRTRPARGGLDSIALERSPRGDESARRASPGSAVPLGAAAQAHRLPQARGCNARRRGCADVRRSLRHGG